ncbi:MAG: LamG domain-containing protein [Polyangiaceae bacterium]|nr:LamG domain-containing protein [Polyangiaceae bacterium]
MLLSGVVLSGCPLNDHYAVRRDSVQADGATAGTRASGGSADIGESGAGEAPTGGDASNTGGSGVATGGAQTGSGGSSATGGESVTTGGEPHGTGGTSETGSTSGTGGTPATGGASATGGDVLTTGGVTNGGAADETGGLGAAGAPESSETGGAELGGSPDPGQGGTDSYAGNTGTDGTDRCPQDANKVGPGVCGCGTAEADCLAHRYTFDGSGTAVVDSVGSDDGTVKYATLSGDGELVFSGGTAMGNATYVDFPDGILSSLTNATLELWVTWGGGAAHQRILDFGDYTQSAFDTSGKSYVFLTPKHSVGTARVSFSLRGSDYATNVDASAALSIGQMSQVAVVFGAGTNNFRLYVNGVSQKSAAMPGRLSAINDVNNWLGRSQFNDDPYFNGTIHEFRIYKVALTQEQIAASFDAGPDVLSGE